jgi:AcrR family transcriptional regulator
MPDAVLDEERLRRLRDALGDRPWHAVTVAELAAAAGLSRMTLHRRGIGKDELLRQLAGLLEREYREALLPALVARADGRTRLRMALTAVCEVDERSLGVLHALGEGLGEVFHDPGDGPVLTRATFTDGLRRILEDGVADGTLRTEDPLASATLLFNATGWTYRHLRLGHRWPAERARTSVVDLVVDGVAAPGG